MCFAVPTILYAQNGESFEEYKNRKRTEFSGYVSRKRRDFDEYRRRRNAEFAEYVRKAWQQFEPQPVIPHPKDNPTPPVVIPDDQQPPVINPQPVIIDEVITPPSPQPQPEPVEPIDEEDMQSTQTVSFVFFGTAEKVRVDKSEMFKLNSIDENSVADAWLELSGDNYTNLVYDCLEIRKRRQLCDWAYLMMLCSMADEVCGKETNESVLLTAYVYCQSGYKMRLGSADGHLHMLFASEHLIYNWPYYDLDGKKYYPLSKIEGNINICSQSYPKESSMSLYITREQIFEYSQTTFSEHVSKHYPDMDVTLCVNKNLLDFYTSYPTSMIGENPVSRWAMYANTPISSRVKSMLYPELKKSISGCGQLEAVEKLLNWVQTGFEYEYDEKVWGADRAFFAEESLYYPYCDCEDRSILFSHLVRDLLDLDVILVFYPRHLATAIRFVSEVQGDYIMLNGSKYVICDPTYIGAKVGMTMPDMDNTTAKVILIGD